MASCKSREGTVSGSTLRVIYHMRVFFNWVIKRGGGIN